MCSLGQMVSLNNRLVTTVLINRRMGLQHVFAFEWGGSNVCSRNCNVICDLHGVSAFLCAAIVKSLKKYQIILHLQRGQMGIGVEFPQQNLHHTKYSTLLCVFLHAGIGLRKRNLAT